MASGAPPAGPSLHVVHGDTRPDPELRLRRFRQDHPGITIEWRNPWEAEMTEPDGSKRWVVRYQLHELLDEVERRLAEQAVSGQGSGE